MRAALWLLPVCFAALLITAVGCAEEEPEPVMMGPDQSAELADAQARIAELERQLANARAAANRGQPDMGRIQNLENEIDRLRNELASARADAAAANARAAEAMENAQQPINWSAIPGGVMTSLDGTILFDSGEAELRSTAKPILDSLAQTVINQYQDREIFIYGHTDNRPIKHSGWDDNYELSCQRSLAVLRYLQKVGVAADMGACGWGMSQPVADNATDQGRQQNRRVEVYVMEKRGPDAMASSNQ